MWGTLQICYLQPETDKNAAQEVPIKRIGKEEGRGKDGGREGGRKGGRKGGKKGGRSHQGRFEQRTQIRD